ncbi:MAG: hypothetical protein FWE53_00450 [Firmicutes bacterium]|nr:hypothetical protein [Bacillota bacterium]
MNALLLSFFQDLFNNWVALTLIIVAVVLIAVGLILYFLLFRKKLKSKISGAIAGAKDAKEQKALKTEKNQALAGNVFAEEEARKKAKKDKNEETVARFESTVKTVVNETKSANEGTRNFQGQLNEQKTVERTTAAENKTDRGGFDAMGQFGKDNKY